MNSSFAEPQRTEFLLGIKHPFSSVRDHWGASTRYWDDTIGITNQRRFESEKVADLQARREPDMNSTGARAGWNGAESSGWIDPIAAKPPVRSTNSQAALTFGPIDPSANPADERFAGVASLIGC